MRSKWVCRPRSSIARGLLLAHRRSINAVVRQCIKDVDYGDDSRTFGNFFATETMRIASPRPSVHGARVQLSRPSASRAIWIPKAFPLQLTSGVFMISNS